MFDWVMGLLKTLWMIVQLIFSFFKALAGMGALTMNSIYEAAHRLTYTFSGWGASILLMSPFSFTGGAGADGVFSSSTNAGVQTSLDTAMQHLGLGGLPIVCIEAGMALTMICFFYGFAESSVQLEKTNIQLIFSRILRWIIAFGLVSVSFLMFSYLFTAFRSIYTLVGDGGGGGGAFAVSASSGTASTDSISLYFANQLDHIKPTTTGGDVALLDVQSLIDTPMSTDPSTLTYSASDWTSIRNGGVGMIIVLFGLVKLFKKAVKFIIEQVPAFAKVVVFFICAPFGLAMYAAPETQQKANSYIRQFGGAVLTNLFKVVSISLAAYIACNLAFPIGGASVSVLNVQEVAAQVFNAAFSGSVIAGGATIDPMLAAELAFLATSGGLLGYQLFFDLIGKASEVAERFAHEIMT